MRYRIVVTDVTDYGSEHCVAGWDLLAKRMVRPEPAPKAFWAKAFVGSTGVFWPGRIVEFGGEIPAGQAYPHATEDVVAKLDTLRRINSIDLTKLPFAVAGSVAPSVDDLFDQQLRRNGLKVYVPVNTKCRSLGSIEIDRDQLAFAQDQWRDEPPKLRGLIAKEKLNLSVTSTILRAEFLSGGLKAVNELLPKSGSLHIRIGLARPFPDDKCYAQINGIYGSRRA